MRSLVNTICRSSIFFVFELISNIIKKDEINAEQLILESEKNKYGKSLYEEISRELEELKQEIKQNKDLDGDAFIPKCVKR